MSTSYEFYGRGKSSVTWDKLFETPGLTRVRNRGSGRHTRWAISDDNNYLWCYGDRKNVQSFERYGANFVDEMINNISIHTRVKIRSEHGAEFPRCPEKIKVIRKGHIAIHNEIDKMLKGTRKRKRGDMK